MQFAAALSRRADTNDAVREIVASLRRQLFGSVDLLTVFFTREHQERAAQIARQLRQALHPRVLIGCSAEGVIGGEREVEREPGLSALAGSLPGVILEPFQIHYIEWDYILNNARNPLRRKLGIRRDTLPGDEDETRAFLLFGDPFTTPVIELMEALDAIGGAPTVGGMASSGEQPGQNVLLLDDQIYDDGVVGMRIAGPIRVDAIVSQGCKPVGETMLVTKADEQTIHALGGKPALEAAQNMLLDLPEDEQEQIQNGALFLGIVTNEYQDTFDRGDFLVRGVLGADPESGALVIGDEIRAGQTVQFQLQDARSADEDLRLLMRRATANDSAPAGGLVFSCNGRGLRMFEQPNHDVRAVLEAVPETPLAGFFAAGELGPVGGKSCLHGQTVSVVLFRSSLKA